MGVSIKTTLATFKYCWYHICGNPHLYKWWVLLRLPSICDKKFDSITASETLVIGNRTSVISVTVSAICNCCIHNCIAVYIGDNCFWLVSRLSGRTLACRSWVLGSKSHLRHWNSDNFFNFRQITAHSYL